MNDELIKQQLMNPDTRRKAFECLVRQYSEQMYWKIRHIVFQHEDADDVLQNVFMKAWSRIDEFRGDSKISTWLYRISVNEAIDFTRKKREETGNDKAITSAAKNIADNYFDADEAERKLIKAINALPEAQKATFTLRYYDEMSYKEMSMILGTSEAGLKTNYHLAVKKIKEYFEKNN